MQINSMEQLRSEIDRNYPYWRARLLRAGDLATLAQRYGVGQFSTKDIIGLWHIGLLRADVVLSSKPIENPKMPSLATQDGGSSFAYSDLRQAAHRPEGYGSAFIDLSADTSNEDLEPLFHPYRAYILFHVDRTLKVKTTSTQYLLYEPGVMTVVQHLAEDKKRWTSSVEFAERFHHWNLVTEVAIATEPLSYDVIYLDQHPNSHAEPATNSYEQSMREILVSMGKFEIQRMRQDIVFDAEQLDDNRTVHVLLRLMKAQERDRLKGKLGGSMHLLAMAESIRRAAERAYGENFPEEDEIGPGTWFPGARKILYGNERVFDAPPSDLRDYLTHLGIDFAVKVRCYVEGETEFGAISHAVGGLGHVQVINLSGNVSERARKGLAFVESLVADKRAGVFSVILLDGDREEYVRIVKKAAQDEKFHGCFFISDPDIECGNFTPEELIEIAVEATSDWEMNRESSLSRRQALIRECGRISSNKDLLSFLSEHGITNIRKGEAWGNELMKYAIMHPQFPANHSRQGQERPIFNAAQALIRMRSISFQYSLAKEKIDPITGRAVARNSTLGIGSGKSSA